MQSNGSTPHRTDVKRGGRVRVERGLFTRADKWIAVFSDGTGEHARTLGWIKSDRHRDGLTLSQARAAREKLVVGIREGDVVIGDRSLALAKLLDSYLARERGPLGSREESTIKLHEQRLRDHVLRVLGPNLRAADVTVQHVRRVRDRAIEKRLTGSTVSGIRSAFSAMMAHAVRDLGAISRNPVRDLERGELPSVKRTSEPRYLSVEQVESIFDLMSDTFRPAAALCFWGALRIGEALRLTWAGVDFDAGTIDVPGYKTEASKATIPLLPPLAGELKAQRERLGRRGFDRIRAEALVIQTSTGRSPGPRNALRALQGAAKRAELNGAGREPVGLHDLRHSLAAHAFSIGMSPPEIARLLRHANPSVTLTVYAGLAEEGAVERLRERLVAGLAT